MTVCIPPVKLSRGRMVEEGLITNFMKFYIFYVKIILLIFCFADCLYQIEINFNNYQLRVCKFLVKSFFWCSLWFLTQNLMTSQYFICNIYLAKKIRF